MPGGFPSQMAGAGVVITHRFGVQDAPKAYEIFRDKKDECVKVVLTP